VNEKLATALAEQAHQAALRDDFAAATQKLDEAERIAPRFALIAHYRSNIAYLQGDRAGAIKALRRAVELEPDNPLFRTNLERLEAAGKTGPK
jgi:Flp pilus assembly protein TadD